MKLFIWTDFSPDCTGGLAFAIASNEQEARKLVIEYTGWEPDDWGDLEVTSLDHPIARSVSGGS